MVTDIERQFFEAFGIVPKWGTVCNHCDCQEFEKAKFYYFDKGICCGCYHSADGFYYPQITDRILLELICIWNNACLYLEDSIAPINYPKVTESVLEYFVDIENYRFIKDKKEIKQQVQALFNDNK